jgi:hypothetical protein
MSDIRVRGKVTTIIRQEFVAQDEILIHEL